MMPRRRWAIGWPAFTGSPSLIRYSSTRPATALPTRLRRIGLTVPTNERGSAIVSPRAAVTSTLGAGGGPNFPPPFGGWAGDWPVGSSIHPPTAKAMARSTAPPLPAVETRMAGPWVLWFLGLAASSAGFPLGRRLLEIGLDQAQQLLEL